MQLMTEESRSRNRPPGLGKPVALGDAADSANVARAAAQASEEELRAPGEPDREDRPQPREQEILEGDGRWRVLLVDDHRLMREGLQALLAEEKDIEVVGQAGNGVEAVEKAESLRPDVVVMDVLMPVMDGVEAARQISAKHPDMRIIGLSMFDEADMARKMLQAGAFTYLPKAGPAKELLAAIRGK